MKEVVSIAMPSTLPAGNLALALAGSVLLALLITLLPIRRRSLPARHALRYA